MASDGHNELIKAENVMRFCEISVTILYVITMASIRYEGAFLRVKEFPW